MKFACTHCGELVGQDRNLEGLNYCTSCRKLFLIPPEPKVPPWILGVLFVLIVNCKLLCHI